MCGSLVRAHRPECPGGLAVSELPLGCAPVESEGVCRSQRPHDLLQMKRLPEEDCVSPAVGVSCAVGVNAVQAAE